METKNKMMVGMLPYCAARTGRVYDKRAVVCCGHREIDPRECLSCSVVKNN